MELYKALMMEDTKLVNFNVGGTFGKVCANCLALG
jgi:hypothetical protein